MANTVKKVDIPVFEEESSWRNITKYNKALVPVAVMISLGLLSKLGIVGDMSVEDAVTLLTTGALVWLIPNKKT